MITNTYTLIKKLLFTGVGKSSLVLFFGSVFVGGLNYLFHPIIFNFLGVKRYGEIASLLSIYTIISVSIIALSTVVVKFTSTYKAQKDFGSVATLLIELTKKLTLIGILLFLVIFLLSNSISSFLKLDSAFPVVMLGMMIFLSFLFYTNLGILQGLLDFVFYTFTNILVAILRLVLPVLVIVVLGFGVTGVMFSVSLGLAFGYLVSFLPLIFLFKEKRKSGLDWAPFLKFSFSTLLAVLGSSLLISTDIVLVKHFFDPVLAGVYAAASTLGKIILFTIAPITQVMFPLISVRHEAKSKYLHLLNFALLIASLIAGSITFVYFFLPKLVVGILFPRSPEIAQYLGLFGVFITVYSLTYIFVNFFLSVRKTKASLLVVIAGLLEGALLWFYHGSIFEVLYICIGVNVLLLGFLVVYFLISYGKKAI